MAKIDSCLGEIQSYNEFLLDKLAQKTVRRSTVKHKVGTPLGCNRCDYSTKTISALKKHKKNEHVISFEASLSLRAHPQSTRNNSIVEKLMLEDISASELETDTLNLDEKAIRYTCLECKLVTTDKENMDMHVRDQHLPNENEDVKFTCTKCGHDFDEVDNYSAHMNIHDNHEKPCKQPSNRISHDILDGFSSIETRVFGEILEYLCIIPDKRDNWNQSDIMFIVTEDHNDSDCDIVELTCRKCPFECESKDEMDAHNKTKHKTLNADQDEGYTFKCHLCDYRSNETRKIDTHGLIDHGILTCGRCDYRAEDRQIMRKHMETHTGRNILPCGICEFETRKKATLDKHMNSKHSQIPKSTGPDGTELNCGKCEKKFVGSVALRYHKCSQLSTKYPCDYNDCKFEAKDIPEIVRHINKEHRRIVHPCQHCEYETGDKVNLIEHIKANHQQLSMLNSLFSQQNHLCESFTVFKQDIGELLQNLIQGQNTMRSELLLLKENKANGNKEKKTKPADSDHAQNVKPTKDTYAKKAAGNANIETSNSNPETKKSSKTNEVSLPSLVAWVGDSHTHNLDRRAFENLSNTKVDISIAYTVGADANARFPEKNLKKIVPEKLANKKFDTLVLQGGCNEISNLNVTSNFKPEDVKLWEKKVCESRTKMFEIAVESLENNTDLKKVIIVTSLPRYDPEDRDPYGIKAKLNQYGNSVYTSLWMQKGCPGDIVIADQKLDCKGELRNKRFGNPDSNLDGKPWDGIHLRGKLGSRHYTNSMANIFAVSYPGLQINWGANQSADNNPHITCPQTNYQRRHFTTSRPNTRNNDSYGQRRGEHNYQGRNTASGFSHQGDAGRSRGFKRNNAGLKNNYQGQGEYAIPVRNRFQGNF